MVKFKANAAYQQALAINHTGVSPNLIMCRKFRVTQDKNQCRYMLSNIKV